MANNYWRAKMIQETNKKRWLKVNPILTDKSGIYILTRVDENGIKYAYVGQAKNILSRLAQHLAGYQHIDLSLKKHKLYSEQNPYGWKANFVYCDIEKLDEFEREYIKEYAKSGFQLRNKTSGGQDNGKVGIDDNKPSKGYYDGLKQGYQNCLKEIREYFDKYLIFLMRRDEECFKKNGEVKEIYKKKWQEFKELLENDKG